ncbi:hypothetical protein [Streptomyces odontomachi]|nr:hypothetical protein [Streptomyces sp. ODS25]
MATVTCAIGGPAPAAALRRTARFGSAPVGGLAALAALAAG